MAEQNNRLEYIIYDLLKKQRCTLTTAESATGGMLASTLINVPGISEFFQEGYVTYSDAAKIKVLQVNPETIGTYGVVSCETAAEMAACAARIAECDAALSVTGVAGPGGGTKDCPVGLVYIGCFFKGSIETRRCMFVGDRMEIRAAAVRRALLFLKQKLEEVKEENDAGEGEV